MRIPNWIREFFLLPPSPQEPHRRTVIVGGIRRPGPRGKGKHAWRSDARGAPEPVVIRKNVRPVKRPRPRDAGPEIIRAGNGDPILSMFWAQLYFMMRNCERVRIGQNEHYGKLRGVDILIAAKRDFRRAGIPVSVKLCGSHGFIELEGGE